MADLARPRVKNENQVWDVLLLEWVAMTQPGGGSGAGDASAANQVIGNASLSSIDGKLPALIGGRIPVVLPAGGTGLTDAELRAAPVPVLGPLTDAQLRASAVLTTQSNPSTATLTNVTSSAASLQLLTSTAGRKGAYFYNDTDKKCYLKLGTTASATSFTVLIAPAGFYELPIPCYTGRIDGIWEAGPTGDIRITELTA